MWFVNLVGFWQIETGRKSKNSQVAVCIDAMGLQSLQWKAALAMLASLLVLQPNVTDAAQCCW
jgi:hypothetical protein